jgi:ribonucleotide reductase alpha subunit
MRVEKCCLICMMQVTKRDGSLQDVRFDKITRRIQHLCYSLDASVSPVKVAQKVCASLYDTITTSEVDVLSAEVAVAMTTEHPDYGTLAARILVSNLHRSTGVGVVEVFGKMRHMLRDDVWGAITSNQGALDAMLDFKRDYSYDFFAVRTLERMYLTRVNGVICERPQHMLLRVALGIWGPDLQRVKETYDALSQKLFTHATPTLFNAGMKNGQYSSCFMKGTMVCTTNRGPLRIEEVEVGDMVITHTGNTKMVSQIHMNPIGDRKLYNVKVFKSPSFGVTGNHRMWSMFNPKTAGVNEPTWHSIEDLRIGDYIAMPRPATRGSSIDVIDVSSVLRAILPSDLHFEEDAMTVKTNMIIAIQKHKNGFPIDVRRSTKAINKNWIVTQDFAWFIGVWLGDGCIVHDRNGKPKALNVVGASSHTTLLERVTSIGRNVFGVEPSIHEHKGQDLTSITWYNTNIALVFEHLFGSGHLNKHLNERMYSWGCDLVVALLGGVISSDGCVSKHGVVCIAMTGHDILQGLYHLARQAGIDVSFSKIKKKQKESHHDQWRMNVPWTSEIKQWVWKKYIAKRPTKDLKYSGRQMVVDGQVFLKITEKTQIHSHETHVYTLGVDDDHSYNVEGLLCENCYLLGVEDSIDGIYKAVSDCAKISKWAGGIGLHVHNIRSRNTLIRGTNGTSSGIIPMMRVLNATARYVNQAGRRPGSFAVYLEPWHPDVFDFLDAKKNHGDEEQRARDLFYSLWVPDLFMKRVEEGGMWSLMDPDSCPGLPDAYGQAFEELYTRFEAEGRSVRQVEAQKLWFAILTSQIETGTPYLCYKDACNEKSNQKNLGTIKSSNLCVAPETKVLTRKGYVAIEGLKDTEVEVWNGYEWSATTVRQTSDSAELLRILFDNGAVLECTLYHTFYYANGQKTEAHRLRPRDKVLSWKDPDGKLVDGQRVVETQRTGRKDKTYCFTEPTRHMGVFNGILTGQCSEIIEYSSPEEYGVCNLASIALPMFVKGGEYDYDALAKVTRIAARNLDKVIDVTYYPTPEARRSNMRHRPIGIGVQGLADVFQLMRLPHESEEAAKVNRLIFETMYYAAIDASIELAASLGPYETYQGSPASQGLLQYDLWESAPVSKDMWDWDGLKQRLARHGLRNSLSIAIMPTASTSQILGNTECIEPYTSNIYLRRTMAGEFVVVNRHLVKDLMALGKWNEAMKERLISSDGSIQSVPDLPDSIKDLYKTAWEIKQKTLIDLSADRGPFVCQSQSLNLFVTDATYKKLSSMHFYAWKAGLKTGQYYLRTQAASRPVPVGLSCSMDNPECLMCSS